MSKEQQVRFLKLIYDNQVVFSLCDEDLGLCDHLKHTIPIIMDKPVYLPHRDYTCSVTGQGVKVS